MSQFVCPSCGRVVDAQAAPGMAQMCPACGTTITVPPPQGAGLADGVPAPAPSQGMAIGALVCGILGLVTCLPPLGLVGLVLGIVAVVRANNQPQRYAGKGMAIGGICTGGVSLVTLPLLIAMLLPPLARARELAKRTVCAANMQGIGIALATYANENDGKYPPSLDVLLDEGAIAPQQLICPSGDGSPNYVYIAGQTTDDDLRAPLLYEPIENHEDGGNILFIDGHVEFIKEPGYSEILEPYLGSSP
jgi:prepilin-type processing-associated H-X9-DG protein